MSAGFKAFGLETMQTPRSPFRDSFRIADNPLGGFIHGCFQGKNVHDGPQYCDALSARGAIMCLNVE